MTGLCTCRACFAARSLTRALARDRKRSDSERRRTLYPGQHFQLDALPPYLELTRTRSGWSLRQYQPPRSRP